MTTSLPASIRALIDSFETISVFADAVGCGYEAARKMRSRDRIAPEYWQDVIRACEAIGLQGVDADWLTAKHSRHAEPAAPSAESGKGDCPPLLMQRPAGAMSEANSREADQ